MRGVFIQATENDPVNTTYLLCPRVDVNDQLSIDDGTPQRSLWVFMMGEEKSRHFPVGIVTVDLEWSVSQGRGIRGCRERTMQTICSLVSRLVRTTSNTLTPSDFSATQ